MAVRGHQRRVARGGSVRGVCLACDVCRRAHALLGAPPFVLLFRCVLSDDARVASMISRRLLFAPRSLIFSPR